MSKYINADRIKSILGDVISELQKENQEAQASIVMAVLNGLNEIPESIVRCKDCKFFDVDGVRGRQVDGQEVRMCKKFYNYPFLANEYCSRGKRRESK